ncbi:hypothetical protein N7489_011764 [Penicillium chrysogenum]|uniref:Uncharacterized protein n=1 Tax=Penicillium chrysogenum TaxID=5076 RepID=A0ABQ8W202_PENCH|nr:uncharacterized protein N7489_011764 [Penicillium chrysogenum]KAJ5231056.1 hypothetical protein N7489_011764 [Penicillium chrysogenum]KAJ5253384.1 hypothetical protein N7505_012047 [Penicillium chrysogenum]KAJ5268440.1 hypothetical protein N7524_005899 [Penicillium chrysogenum]KAJ6162797.1 hypothetical protein N7497_002776 [Penicillium chrysogenum]
MARLRTAIQLLSLSQQCYTRALLRVQPDLIAEKLLVQDKKNTAKFKPDAHQHESNIKSEVTTLSNDTTECLHLERATLVVGCYSKTLDLLVHLCKIPRFLRAAIFVAT